MKVATKKSKYWGVIWHKPNAKWMAFIVVQGKIQKCGLYEDEEEAAKAYDR